MRFKAHQCIWSGRFHGNTVEAIADCLTANVERAEIDIMMLPGSGWLVLSHEFTLEMRARLDFRAPPLEEVVRLMESMPNAPTHIELDMMDVEPIPVPRLEELLALTRGMHERVIFNNVGDWNLRRLVRLAPAVRIGFDPAGYLDVEDTDLPLGAYGYHDAHALARAVHGDVREYLFDRLGGILRLVPGCEEVHLRLSAFERMRDDGFDVAAFCHARGMLLDVWTLDAGTPGWRERLGVAVEAGADMVTTNTAPALRSAMV